MADTYVLTDEQLGVLLGRNRRLQILVAFWVPLVVIALVYVIGYYRLQASDAKRCTEHVRESSAVRALARTYGTPIVPPAGASPDILRATANGNTQRAQRADELIRLIDAAQAC